MRSCAELYRYLNFDQIEGFEDASRIISAKEEAQVLMVSPWTAMLTIQSFLALHPHMGDRARR